jgi:hypothetical protein
MMVVLLLYAYCVGIPSSRRIERAWWEDAPFRVLTGNQQPDHSRISDFRLVHLDALAGLFVQVLRLCQKAGLLSLGNVALDGTKVKANASKHKAMSHERMLKTEAQPRSRISTLCSREGLAGASPSMPAPIRGAWCALRKAARAAACSITNLLSGIRWLAASCFPASG